MWTAKKMGENGGNLHPFPQEKD